MTLGTGSSGEDVVEVRCDSNAPTGEGMVYKTSYGNVYRSACCEGSGTHFLFDVRVYRKESQ